MSRNASLILTLRPRLTLLGILLLGYLALRGSHALAGVDGWLLEWQEQLLAPPPNPVVVVEIDEASLATHGQWPWSRHKHAALVAWLDAAGAAAIGLDMIFAEPSRFGVPDDAALAAAMQHSGRVVLPVAVDSAAAPPASIDNMSAEPHSAWRPSYPLPELESAAAALGHARTGLAQNGRLRELQAFLSLPNGRRLPAFPLALALIGGELDPHLRTERQRWLLPGDISRHLPPRFSYIDVLGGEVAKEAFADKYVLVGVSSQGLVPHYPLTASGHGPNQPALIFNAVATTALLNRSILCHVPDWQRHALAALLLVALVLQPLTVLRRGSGRVALALGLTALLVQQIALRQGYYLPNVEALALLTLAWLAIRLYHAEHLSAALLRLRGESEAVLDAVADGVLLIDAEGRISFANRRAAELLDKNLSQLLNCGIDDLGLRGPGGWRAQSLYAAPRGGSAIATAKRGAGGGAEEIPGDLPRQAADRGAPGVARASVYLYSSAAQPRVLKVTASPVPGREATVLAMDDVTSLYRLQRKLSHQARHDALTALPNRAYMQQLIERAIRTQRDDGRAGQLTVAFVDFDNFKRVNDVLGHSAGDELLVQLAGLLRSHFGDGYRLARFGGDEFLLLCRVERSVLNDALRRFIQALQRPLAVAGQHIHCQCSIGVSLYPQHGEQAEELIRCADMAMYRAKRHSGSHYCFHTSGGAGFDQRLRLEHALHQALERDELEVHYQPRVSLVSGHTSGAEALLRWQHPQDGLRLPASFLPAAQELGLMAPISRWVMHRVFNDIRSLSTDLSTPLRISMNLSAQQFVQDSLEVELEAALLECGAPAGWVELEITESMLVHDFNRANRIIARLRARGMLVSLDDFGTGYSALNYLINLPVDTIKIDQSFISQLRYRKSGDVTRAIVHLARDLGFATIAEGAENSEQVDFLRAIGCDEVQGFFYSQALPLDEFRSYQPRGSSTGNR